MRAPYLWPVVLLALAAPALPQSRGAAGEPHYNGWDLQRKFREIDKKLKGAQSLRQLQSSQRSAVRRIADLEADLRDARRNIHELQLKLETLNAALEECREEMVALRKEAGRPGRTPDTGSQGKGRATPETTGPVARVVDDRMSRRLGACIVSGHVRNLTDRPLTFIVVKVDFLDDEGEVVRSSAGYTSPAVIAANATAAFKVQVRDSRRIRRHRVTVEKNL
ncbi:MAG: FxLYD domain-containing protein [bacterium]